MATLLLETLLNAHSTSPGGKDYMVRMYQDGKEFTVTIAFGPAGRLSQSSNKYQGPDQATAKRIFDAAVKAKLRGSGSSVYGIVHQQDHSGNITNAPAQSPTKAKAPNAKSPFDCQNLSVIDSEDQLRVMLASGDYLIQGKADGERLSILREYDKASKVGSTAFFNKANVTSKVDMNLSNPMLNELITLLGRIGDPTSIFLDGEIVAGNVYYLFDLLIDGSGTDITSLSYLERFKRLEAMVAPSFEYLKLIPTALPSQGFDAQWDFYQKIKANNGEGVVLHNIHSPHEPGKGKNHWKFKFKERSTCIVSSIGENGLRSVGLQMLTVPMSWADDVALVDVGNVTIPANHDIPNPGDLVDVEYLYKYFDGAFIQPVYKGVRTDVLKEECTLSQVRRYKTEMAIENMV